MLGKQALAFVAVALFGLSECYVSKQQIPCSGKIEESACSFCINTTYARRPSKTRPLRRYMKSLRNLVQMGDFGNFTWNASAILKGIDMKKTTVTFFTWSNESPSCSGEDRSKCMGRPIKGCCGIPLDRGGCQATECSEGVVFLGLSSGSSRDANKRSVRDVPMRKTDCLDSTVPKIKEYRYTYACPEVVPDWLKKLDAVCLRFNLVTQDYEAEKRRPRQESTNQQDALEDIRRDMARPVKKMCTFPLPKGRLEQEPATAHKRVNFNILLNRDVREMVSLSWDGRVVVDGLRNSTVQCSMKTVTNYSEVTSLRHVNYGNDVDSCVILWREAGPFPTLCMAHNLANTSTLDKKKTANKSDTFVTMLVVSCLGGVALLCLALCACLTVRRNVDQFVKTRDEIPEHLNRILKEDLSDFGVQENKMLGVSEAALDSSRSSVEV